MPEGNRLQARPKGVQTYDGYGKVKNHGFSGMEAEVKTENSVKFDSVDTGALRS